MKIYLSSRLIPLLNDLWMGRRGFFIVIHEAVAYSSVYSSVVDVELFEFDGTWGRFVFDIEFDVAGGEGADF